MRGEAFIEMQAFEAMNAADRERRRQDLRQSAQCGGRFPAPTRFAHHGQTPDQFVVLSDRRRRRRYAAFAIGIVGLSATTIGFPVTDVAKRFDHLDEAIAYCESWIDNRRHAAL